jgi:heptosyltransferase-2
LKALIAHAELVIANDTGPRHIAVALRRKIITLFGPNDPTWTQTGYPHEIQIVGHAPCAPCQKPRCRQPTRICMESITTAQVIAAAERLLGVPQGPLRRLSQD